MPASNTILSCPVPSLSLIPFTIAPALEVSELDHIWHLTPTMSASSCYVCFLRIGKLLNLRLHIIFHVPHNFTFSIFDTRAEKTEQIQQAAFIFARVARDADEIAASLRISPRTVQANDPPTSISRGVGPTRLSGRAAFSQSTTSTARR